MNVWTFLLFFYLCCFRGIMSLWVPLSISFRMYTIFSMNFANNIHILILLPGRNFPRKHAQYDLCSRSAFQITSSPNFLMFRKKLLVLPQGVNITARSCVVLRVRVNWLAAGRCLRNPLSRSSPGTTILCQWNAVTQSPTVLRSFPWPLSAGT